MRLKDKVALVTGGSSGIGTEICKGFAREGAKVGVVASHDIGKAQAVVDAIIADGGEAMALTADITKLGEPKAAVDRIVEAYGGLDILVNSAGIHYPTPLGETSAEDIDRMIDINLRGPMHVIHAAVPAIEARGGGKIINMASTLAFVGWTTHTTYCATKAGIVQLTKVLARELAPKKINVNAIAPGFTATPMNEAFRTEPEFKEQYDYMADITPGDTYSLPEDIVGMALFLATDDGKSMHGSTVLMDQGVATGV